MSLAQVNLMHVVVIGPVLYSIGYYAKKTPDILYNTLGVLTLMIPFIVRLPGFDLSYRNIINATHYFIWIALFGYVAYMKNDTPLGILKSLEILGIVVIFVHGYLLFKKMYAYYI